MCRAAAIVNSGAFREPIKQPIPRGATVNNAGCVEADSDAGPGSGFLSENILQPQVNTWCIHDSAYTYHSFKSGVALQQVIIDLPGKA